MALPSAAAGTVRVAVWGALGRRVAQLFEGAARGTLSLGVDTSRWAAGTCRVVVTAGGARTAAAFTVTRQDRRALGQPRARAAAAVADRLRARTLAFFAATPRRAALGGVGTPERVRR